jgi:hypothetical protein
MKNRPTITALFITVFVPAAMLLHSGILAGGILKRHSLPNHTLKQVTAGRAAALQ